MLDAVRNYVRSLSEDQREKILLSAALVLFYALVCYPILCAGYYHDDPSDSLVRGRLELGQLSLWVYIQHSISGWIFGLGRIFPLYPLFAYLLNYNFHTPHTYQAVRVFTIFLSMLPYGWLVAQLTGRREAGFAVLFLIPFFWSIHFYFDPLPSYGVQLTQTTLFTGLALCFFVKGEDTGRWWWHLLGVLSYACGCLSYEIALVVCPAVLVLAWRRRRTLGSLLAGTWPYLLTTLVYVEITVFARMHATEVYDGITFGKFSYAPVVFAKQLTGTLPLSVWLFGHLYTPHLSRMVNGTHVLLHEALITVVLFPLAWFCFQRLLPKLKISDKAQMAALGVGACLLIIPAAMIAFSEKYQGLPPLQEFAIKWGTGYLPLYMQYTGAGLLGLVGIAKWLDSTPLEKKKRTMTLIAVLFSAITCIGVVMNHWVVLRQNDEWLNPRRLTENALHDGLMQAPQFAGHFIIVAKRTNWQEPEFYYENSGLIPVPFNLYKPDELLPKDKSDTGTIAIDKPFYMLNEPSYFLGKYIRRIDRPFYFLDCEAFQNSNGGYVIVGKIKALHYSTVDGKRKVDGVTLQGARLYLSEKPGIRFFQIADRVLTRMPPDNGRKILFEALGQKSTIASGDWIMLQFPQSTDFSWKIR